MASCRLRLVGREAVVPLLEPGHPAIIALWHFSLVYILYHFRVFPAVIMVSASRDGEWVADALTLWGQIHVRGSRHKGGLAALREMAHTMKERGCNAGVVADGSTGPARKAQKGAVILARDTGAPVIPVGLAARPAWRFHSWDRMILPWPGAKVVVAYGSPIHVPTETRGPALEGYRKAVEVALEEATARAEDSL